MKYILKEITDLYPVWDMQDVYHIQDVIYDKCDGRNLVDVRDGSVSLKTKDGRVTVGPSEDLYIQIKKKHINIFYESEFYKPEDLTKYVNKNVKLQLIWDGSQEQLDVLRGTLEDKMVDNFTFKLSLLPTEQRVNVILYSVKKSSEVSKGSLVTVFRNNNEVQIN